jgi:hypothetical protein
MRARSGWRSAAWKRSVGGLLWRRVTVGGRLRGGVASGVCWDEGAGEEVQECIPEGVKNRIHEKGKRNKPLTKTRERKNKAKSPIRVRVEHVFGMMTNTMKGILIRSIGIARACFNIGLMNLVYNLSRYAYLRRIRACA